MKVIELQEYERYILSYNQMNRRDKDLLDQFCLKYPSLFNPHSTFIEITPIGNVGIIKLDTFIINIIPKFMNLQSDLIKLLLFVNDLPLDKLNSVELSGSYTIIDILAMLFISNVKDILKHGLIADYQEISEESSKIRGKVNLLQSSIVSMGLFHKFKIQYDDFIFDILENQIILSGIKLFLILPISDAIHSELIELIRHFEIISEIKINKGILREININRFNQHYNPAFMILKALINRIYISSFAIDGEISISDFLVNMPRVFEKFVEKVLRIVFKKQPFNLTTQYVHYDSIRNCTTGRKIHVRPDIVLKSKTYNYPIDVKYKSYHENISTSDIYQLFFYGQVFKVDTVIIHPGDGFSKEVIIIDQINEKKLILVLKISISDLLDSDLRGESHNLILNTLLEFWNLHE